MSENASVGFERVLARAFLACASVLVALLLAEWFARAYLPTRPPIESRYPVEAIRQPRPYTMFGGRRGSDGHNQLGYRGEAPSPVKAEGEYRVFLLGGSTVYVGDPPIAELLEELCRDDGRAGVEVYNFGVVSSVSGMDLARVLFEIGDLSPDLILTYSGGNDFIAPAQYDPRPGYPFNFIVYEHNPLLDTDASSYPTLAVALYGSHLLRYLIPGYFVDAFVPLEAKRSEAGYGSRAWVERIATTYVGNLLKADRVAEAFGARFAAFFQPLVWFKTTPVGVERSYATPGARSLALQFRQLVRAEADVARREHALRFVDLSALYESAPRQVFSDSIHTLQEAKSSAARAIYRELVAAELLPPRDSGGDAAAGR